MYPKPKNISVQDIIVVTFEGKIFINMLMTAPHAATSAMPPSALNIMI